MSTGIPHPSLDLPKVRWAEWLLCSARDGADGPELSPKSTLLVISQSIYGFIFGKVWKDH